MATGTQVRFRADDIWDMPDDGKRYEVIDGELYMTTAPDLDHQRPLTGLPSYIGPYLRTHRLGSIFTAPVGLILDEENGIQPDLVYVSRERAGILTRRGIRGVPDMVAEVVSPSTEGRDRGASSGATRPPACATTGSSIRRRTRSKRTGWANVAMSWPVPMALASGSTLSFSRS